MNFYKAVKWMSKHRFDEIAINSTAKKKPEEDDKYHYIGLEHLDSGSLTVSRWGSDAAPKGEKLIMKEGDVLFGKRRAYQKKVAIAPFDGIFSAHGMVLRPNEKVVDKDFFPMFISSDYFLDAAIAISVGSLSPTINWKDLAKLKFDLPDLEEQKKTAKVLWAMHDTMEGYKSLLAATDELVKSQFIEMFKNEPKGKLSDVALITMGQSPDGKTYNTNKKGTPFYQGKTEFSDLYIKDPVTWTTAPSRMAEPNDVLMSVRAPVGSTNIAVQECCLGRGLAGIRPTNGKSTTMFILYSMRNIEDEIENMGVGSTFKAINKKQVFDLPIPIASIEKQNKFVAFAEQVDKSKFALQKSMDDLRTMFNKVLSGNLDESL